MINKKAFIYFLSCVLLSTVVFSSSNKVLAATVQRLQGLNRYETAIDISRSGWQNSDNVILATGENFPDALSAAPLAKQLNAPILLVGNTLDSALNTELTRLAVKNVFIVGGEGVVSKSIRDQLEGKHLTVTRLSGVNRYETSLNIANYIVEKFNIGSEIVVATGEGFPDALSIAPIAANKGMPIILSPKDEFLDITKKYITDNKVTKAFVIGGTGVISDKVMQQLPLPERVWGADRFMTNVAVLNRFAKDISFDKVYAATGYNFPDALAGSALAPKTSSPIILVDKILSDSTADYINLKMPSIKQICALGGEGVVPQSILINNVYGNTQGNISNFGLVAKQGEWIYYNNTTLYKVKTDGTGKTEISKDIPTFINVVSEWVYYIEASSGTNKMYKVRSDGTSRTKLSDDISLYMVVARDWIYYMNASDQGKLYKMKLDGTSKTKLNNEIALDINVSGNWVYYITNLDSGESEIHKVRTDGTGLTMLGGASNMAFLNVSGEYLYFETNDVDGTRGDLVKIKNDGTNHSTIDYDNTEYINVSGDWIYYSNLSDGNKLYKIKTDGTGKMKISDDDAVFINISGDWIYYGTGSQNDTMKVKTDGTERQIVN